MQKWASNLMTLLDEIEQAETIEDAHDLARERFEISEECGLETVFTGVKVSTLRN